MQVVRVYEVQMQQPKSPENQTWYRDRKKRGYIRPENWENPSRSLAVVAGMKKTNDHAEPTKTRALKKKSWKLWS